MGNRYSEPLASGRYSTSIERAAGITLLMLHGYPSNSNAIEIVAKQIGKAPRTLKQWWERREEYSAEGQLPEVAKIEVLRKLVEVREEMRQILADHARRLVSIMDGKAEAADYESLTKGLAVVLEWFYLLDPQISQQEEGEAARGQTINIVSHGVAGLPITLTPRPNASADGDEPL